MPRFEDMDLSENLLKQLFRLGFEQPTPIQSQAIPPGLKGEDVIGIAQTGTGKTLAFSIPMIQQLADGKKMGLIILPTRELALQVDEEIKKIGKYFGVKTAILIGGASMHVQKQQLRRRPNVVIATPGRLIDHLQQKTVNLSNVSYLVLDEADRMLDMGFEPQIRKILPLVPKERQTMLFSATLPEKIADIAKKYMRSPTRVEIARAGTTAETIRQEAYIVHRGDKLSLLHHILGESDGPTLVFSRTKHGAKKIAHKLAELKYKSSEIHSNKSLNQRKEALAGFKSGKYRVLVATDIASRGIDVSNIELVVNYDVPDQLEDYVHRIGRTGRAGKTGKAITFVTPDQKYELTKIERLIRMPIPTTKLPAMKNVGGTAASTERGEERGRQEYGRRRRGAPSAKHNSGHRRSGGGRHGSRKETDYSARGTGAVIQNLPDQFRAKPTEARSQSAARKRSAPRGTRGGRTKTNSRRQRSSR